MTCMVTGVAIKSTGHLSVGDAKEGSGRIKRRKMVGRSFGRSVGPTIAFAFQINAVDGELNRSN